MSWEALAAVGSMVSAIVIAATAIAALIQIRQLRAASQLEGYLAIMREFTSDDFKAARSFVELELSKRMQEDWFREDLATGRGDLRKHPETTVANFWEHMGALVHHGSLDEPLFLDYFAYVCLRHWQLMLPAIELVQQRERLIWEGFGHLAYLCERHIERVHQRPRRLLRPSTTPQAG